MRSAAAVLSTLIGLWLPAGATDATTFTFDPVNPGTTDTLDDVVAVCQAEFTGKAKPATVAEFMSSPSMVMPPIPASGLDGVLLDGSVDPIVGRVSSSLSTPSGITGVHFGCSEPW